MISERIYELRRKNNLSQEELANKLMVSSRAVVKWESGETEPSIANLNALAEIFNVTTDYLLGRDEITSKNNRKYSNFSIALTIILIVISILVIACLIYFSLALIREIREVSYLVAKNNETAKSAPVGLHFEMSKLDTKVFEYALSQGRVISPNDSDFILWKNSLLSKYNLINGEYWCNNYIFINYRPMTFLIILETLLVYSLITSIILIIWILKSKIFRKKVLSIVLAFTSLNLPCGFMLLIHNMANEKNNSNN